LALGHLWWRSRRQQGYLHDLPGRLGFQGGQPGPDAPALLWIHAVSVGESRAALPLVRALADAHPAAHLLITSTTPTGRDTVRELYGPMLGTRLHQAWLPWDLSGASARFLRHWRPQMGLLMETELWPNLMHEAHRQGVPIALVNARLSERSLARGLRFARLMQPAAQQLSCVLAQSEADSLRMARLGRPADAVTGNLKFDNAPEASQVALGRRWRERIGRPVVLLASSREGEERDILEAWRQQFGPARPAVAPLLVIVPRHPQRFDDVAGLIQTAGWVLARRIALDEVHTDFGVVDVLLGDSMGEMTAWYALADLTLMGGSLGPYGSQNLIEPCAVGCPVVLGPSTFNFADAAAEAIRVGAACQVAAPAAVAEALALMAAPARRQAMQQAALRFAQEHRGATEKTLETLGPALSAALEASRSDRPAAQSPAP
jgi:3-deoxy-D-manno-octulosonic-acid transferase